MTREEIEKKILEVLQEEFEIEDPGMEDNLREKYDFDSIDAISLLEFIEELLDSPLTQDEKKLAMEIKNIKEICDYIENLLKARE